MSRDDLARAGLVGAQHVLPVLGVEPSGQPLPGVREPLALYREALLDSLA